MIALLLGNDLQANLNPCTISTTATTGQLQKGNPMEKCESCGEELIGEPWIAEDVWCDFCSEQDDALCRQDDNYSDARDEDWEYPEDDWL